MKALQEILRGSAQELALRYRVPVVRECERFSFGGRNECEEIFMEALRCVDRTSEMRKLPEYDAVIDWMTDTRGQGLLLTGACGRGKSSILCGVLPLLFAHFFNKVVRPVCAEQIPEKLDEVLASRFVCIDDFGTECAIARGGERFEGLNRIINDAESRLKPVFLSTNLNGRQVLDRYGIRTVERITRLCKVVLFSGESLRRGYGSKKDLFDFKEKYEYDS